MTRTYGISGYIASIFVNNQLTPLLAMVGLLLGAFALLITPREEEPQIEVTFANVFIPFPGASAKQVEAVVTNPAEHIISEIAGVHHIYSASSPGLSTLTVQFHVGQQRNEALVRLYNAFYSSTQWQKSHLGIGPPLIKPRGIDDVPIVSATLWSDQPHITAAELTKIADTLASELQRIPGTRDINLIGRTQSYVKIAVDPSRLTSLGLTFQQIENALQSANKSIVAGTVVEDRRNILLQAGQFFQHSQEIENLVVAVQNKTPIYLSDVADVISGENTPNLYVTHSGELHTNSHLPPQPAVTLAIGKKSGINATQVAEDIIEKLNSLEDILIPSEVEITLTRNYGESAQDKSQTLIKKLIFATASVIFLVFIALGRKEALVVGTAIIVTLAITLFASWAWGFTLNRVSLFALIFSIGILVDDAIVVVENIHRHQKICQLPLHQAIPSAVDEVGGPTILATLTVIAALLPMAFVSGLMGPYMLPIPINASTGMMISLAVAFIFAPWMYLKLSSQNHLLAKHTPAPEQNKQNSATRYSRVFLKTMTPLLKQNQGRRNRWIMLTILIVFIVAAIGLVFSQQVVLKMLPFDNKSEFQILVDMPEGTPLEETQRVLFELGEFLKSSEEVTHYQTYAGTSAPINFNGLVRQYYLRNHPHQGDIQVNLRKKSARSKQSHDIVTALRARLHNADANFKNKIKGASIKIVEVPPGPPVLAPLVAEVYGWDTEQREQTAHRLKHFFMRSSEVVEVDTSIEHPQERWDVMIDHNRASLLGVNPSAITNALRTALQGSDITFLHSATTKQLTPIHVTLPEVQKHELATLKAIPVMTARGHTLPLSEMTQWQKNSQSKTIYHKDLTPVSYVTGDVSGSIDSPLYAMADIHQQLKDSGDFKQSQRFLSPPDNPISPTIKWDGEWQITFETFRDMGAAYAVGLILIYLLVVAQFRSYGVPLIIMAPIPLTLIGILPGHALLGQQFTAPSMIGMIALAGIIVRNSILLVDFIQQEVAQGKNLQQATIDAAIIRSKPIILTAMAAMMGGIFILDDPIFGGLAVSLIFGLLISTLLTIFVIPIVYYHYHWKVQTKNNPEQNNGKP